MGMVSKALRRHGTVGAAPISVAETNRGIQIGHDYWQEACTYLRDHRHFGRVYIEAEFADGQMRELTMENKVTIRLS